MNTHFILFIPDPALQADAFHGLATKTPVGQRELKTPQERSDEEAEAELMESEVAGPLGDYAPPYILVKLCLQSEKEGSPLQASFFLFVIREHTFALHVSPY